MGVFLFTLMPGSVKSCEIQKQMFTHSSHSFADVIYEQPAQIMETLKLFGLGENRTKVNYLEK